MVRKPTINSFLLHNDKYEPWEFGTEWEAEFARAILVTFADIEKGKEKMPAGATFDLKLFENLLELLAEGLHNKKPLTVEEVNAFFQMGNVKQMFHQFSYNPATLKAINGLGSSILQAWLEKAISSDITP